LSNVCCFVASVRYTSLIRTDAEVWDVHYVPASEQCDCGFEFQLGHGSIHLTTNYKIKPSFATIDKCAYLVFSSITSRHVSGSTRGHLQVISVTLNNKNRSHYSLFLIFYVTEIVDRLCGLVVIVLGHRSGGPGSISGTTRTKI
jgi:hypothetical protein